MDLIDLSPEEEKTEKKVKEYLRSQGYLPPQDIEDVIAFEQNNPHIPLPPGTSDPLAIIRNGIQKPVRKLVIRVETSESPTGIQNLAARHGDKLTPDILKQMDEDEARDEKKE
ncbi:MAG TPA: hypothetical protein PLP88_01835 [Bacteroidales bacterium]|nr:hypothetical protein [Bacteroidales bacterium]